MRKVLGLLMAGTLFGCSEGAKNVEETVLLSATRALAGKHCESSAILNMLNYQGYSVSEQQIIGAGSTLGFMFEKGDFPFLGSRNLEMRDEAFSNLGISWQGNNSDKNRGWEDILKILKEDNPVVLRVDMRYLPYLYGGKYGSRYMSFGWHMICLFGIDGEKQTAIVTDTAQKGFQEIALKDLWKARFSDTKVLPPGGEYYWVEKAPSQFLPEWDQIALNSLRKVSHNMVNCPIEGDVLAGLEGMKDFPGTIANLQNQVPSYLMGHVLPHMAGCIESFGTGGAAFRQMYGEFLSERAKEGGNPALKTAADKLSLAEEFWHRLAEELTTLSEQKKILKNKEALKGELLRISETARNLYLLEKDFYEYAGTL